MFQNFASFYGNLRINNSIVAVNLLPRTSLSLIFHRNLTSLQKVSLITCPLQRVPYRWKLSVFIRSGWNVQFSDVIIIWSPVACLCHNPLWTRRPRSGSSRCRRAPWSSWWGYRRRPSRWTGGGWGSSPAQPYPVACHPGRGPAINLFHKVQSWFI